MFSVAEMEPTMPAEAVQSLFKNSNGNVCMQTKLSKRGWERSLYCEECNTRQSVEALILLEKDDEAAFARVLQFCKDHKHADYFGAFVQGEGTVTPMETSRRIKEI